MSDTKRLISLTATDEDRQLAKHISLASREPMNVVVSKALRLLQQQYGLSDPPKVRQTAPAE